MQNRAKTGRSRGATTFRLLTIALGALVAVLAPTSGASAYTYRALHTFPCCDDGEFPEAALLRDPAGNLYGTTFSGGLNHEGVVFELLRRDQGASYDYRVIYNFCARLGCSDGREPTAPLIMDTLGDLYGTTSEGGANVHGTLFRLTPNARHTRWSLEVLYDFCSKDSTCPDGDSPGSGLTYQGAQDGALYDGHSALYGTTPSGGKHSGGIAYSLRFEDGRWIQSILHPFCALANCADGGSPSALTMDAGGNLYGVAGGGAHAAGLVFELSPPVSGHVWSASDLYDFCSAAACADGSSPHGPLIIDGLGNLLGTTSDGGAHSAGTVYKLAPGGAQSVLYSFCSEVNCVDGRSPLSGVVMDKLGALYGATVLGGRRNQNAGTVFRLVGTTMKTPYRFCAQPSCADGAYPIVGLAIDKAGNLFGTTERGGSLDEGSVFELVKP